MGNRRFRVHPLAAPWAVVVGALVLTSAAAAAPAGPWATGIARLQAHLDGTTPLSEAELGPLAAALSGEASSVAADREVLRAALRLVAAYESGPGPLFLNTATRAGFPRQPKGDRGLDRAVFAVQQAILDQAYTPAGLQAQRELLDGVAFKTAAYFPGAVAAPADPAAVRRVTINASQPAAWGSPVMFADDPARRPTGCYLAPGSIARVTVPPALVGRGFAVRVGAHSWDLRQKPVIKRLDRVSLVFPITTTVTEVANPLGGGLYLEVPPLAAAGLVEVTLQNVVRAPFYSARSFDHTPLAVWRQTERSHPGPWADFESDRFMMQVPASWIRKLEDPSVLLRDWDTALDAVSALFGYPAVRPKTVLYLQVDVVLRGSANFPGYPQSNTPYDPHRTDPPASDHWLLRGPQTDGAIIFHELGHAQLFSKFAGEVEAVVNLPYVAVLNQGFGVDLDLAFGRSFSNPAISLDQAAIMWMVTPNFRAGKPMDISATERDEVRYQHRGYAKYVEIVRLFGWPVLQRFWRATQVDFRPGMEYPRSADPTDDRILRLSQQAGADLTPLIHFWGVQPAQPATLRAALAAAQLRPSALIYDRLRHYQTLIPRSREEFAAHAAVIYPQGLREGQNPNYGEGWYHHWRPLYDASHGAAAAAALQAILDTYFPAGRPSG